MSMGKPEVPNILRCASNTWDYADSFADGYVKPADVQAAPLGTKPLELPHVNNPDVEYCVPEEVDVCMELMLLRSARKHWMWCNKTSNAPDTSAARSATEANLGRNGIYQVSGCEPPGELASFMRAYNKVVRAVNKGPVKSFCHKRLALLDVHFKRHVLMFHDLERDEGKTTECDMYSCHTVDTHIHAAAAVSGRFFLKFVREKLRNHGDDEVNPGQTLLQLCALHGITADNVDASHFDFQADMSLFQRFDRFNDKYNPAGVAALRTVFLKTNNHQGGLYFADMLKAEMDGADDCVHTEMRLSIYGKSESEWADLAQFIDTHDLLAEKYIIKNKWLIQIPRIYRVFKSTGAVYSFQDVIKNIFQPIFDATLYPDRNPQLTKFLNNVGAFDSVDDESMLDSTEHDLVNPGDFHFKDSPSYQYQLFFLAVNLNVLNQLRKARNLPTISFRPHCGESGDPMHLATSYLLSHGVNHGVNLARSVGLQYLYYLDQIGLAVSPTSNNFLFLKLPDNPFPKFFRRGMFVSLSTDDPMFFHLTSEPLMEEYSIARNEFKLSLLDLSEIARNSVVR